MKIFKKRKKTGKRFTFSIREVQKKNMLTEYYPEVYKDWGLRQSINVSICDIPAYKRLKLPKQRSYVTMDAAKYAIQEFWDAYIQKYELPPLVTHVKRWTVDVETE